MSNTGSAESTERQEIYTIEIYDDDGNPVQLNVTRDRYEHHKRALAFSERLKKEPFVWESEEEKQRAMSWASDNDEEALKKAGCRKWTDD